MHKLSMAVLIVLAAVPLALCQTSPTSQQETPKSQPETAPPKEVPPDLKTIDLGEYTVSPPSGPGWRMSPDPIQATAGEIKFLNVRLRASALVSQTASHQPVTDAHAKLADLGIKRRQAMEGRAQVLRFDSAPRTVGGRECIAITALIKTAEGILPGALPNSNSFIHSLDCFNRGSDGTDRLISLAYNNLAVGENDPQKDKAEEFFASLQFKNSSAK